MSLSGNVLPAQSSRNSSVVLPVLQKQAPTCGAQLRLTLREVFHARTRFIHEFRSDTTGMALPPGGRSPAAPSHRHEPRFFRREGTGLAAFAERFQAAGFVVLVFDYRHLGSSDGDDRGRIVPQEQHDDLRAAIGFVASLPDVDLARIGVWGTSYSGGHAMFVGMIDPRVKAIVAQAPAMAVVSSLIALVGEAGFAGYLDLLAGDHANRNAGRPSGRIPVVGPQGQPSVLSTPDSYAWFQSSRPSPAAPGSRPPRSKAWRAWSNTSPPPSSASCRPSPCC